MNLFCHQAEHNRARMSHAAEPEGKNFDVFVFCLSVTLLNGKICERNMVIKPFQFRNSFDVIA